MGRCNPAATEGEITTFDEVHRVVFNLPTLTRAQLSELEARHAGQGSLPEVPMSDRVSVWVVAFKDRPNLMLQWLDPETGRRKSKSAGTADEKTARQEAADLSYKLTNGLHAEASKMDWSRFRELFEAEFLPGVRPRTREKYQTVFDVFEQIVAPVKLRHVNERLLSRFVKGMRDRKRPGGKTGLAQFTMRNYLVALQTALKWAEKQKIIPAVPTFPTIKVDKKKPQPIPGELFDKLLEKAPDVIWRTYLLCGWWAGLRLSEAAEIRWDRSEEFPWLDLDNNRIVLPAGFVKGCEDQQIAMAPVLRSAIESLSRTDDLLFPFRSKRTGKRISRCGLTNRVLFFAKKAGVKLSMHRLRKGFGCRIAKQLGKGSEAMLHTLMRHKSMQISMDYYASVDDAVQDVMAQLR